MPYTYDEVYAATLEYFGGDDLATTTFFKYALKEHTSEGIVYHERTPDDMHDRLAREVYRIEAGYPQPRAFVEFRGAFDRFRRIVMQGSPMSAVGNPYMLQSTSNCLVVRTHDSLGGIFDTAQDMAHLYAGRCGVGTSLDPLRPSGVPVRNAAGTSSGPVPFADLYSKVCRTIGMDGRRGALMLHMSVQHPDIEAFVTVKQDLTKVTGANISVALTDEFMQAVERDESFTLRWPVDATPEEARVTRVVGARELWHLINRCAHATAEPGLIFMDNYTRNLPAHVYPGFESVATNPCGEVLLSDRDSCRLTSINLKWYVRDRYQKTAEFDFDAFQRDVTLGMRVMDNLVDLEIEALTRIIDNCDTQRATNLWKDVRSRAVLGRRTGLGAHALGDMLSGLCLRYGTDESVAVVDKVYECFRDAAYWSSVQLATEREPFPVFDWEREKDNAFIRRLPKDLQEAIASCGRRNISLLTSAPTGSVSILSQTSSGIEPVYRHQYTRRKKINPSDENVRVDYTDIMGDRWTEFSVEHKAVQEWKDAGCPNWVLGTPDKPAPLNTPFSIEEYYTTVKNSRVDPDAFPSFERWKQATQDNPEFLPVYFVQADQIDPLQRVKVQAALTQYLDHGSSSTINLPKETTVETVEHIYEEAWRQGLKGVTVYRDGSRSGVLVTQPEAGTSIIEAVPPKRPETLPCDIHHVTVQGERWVVLVGLMGTKPYEVFAGRQADIEVPRTHAKGRIVKRKGSKPNRRGRFSIYDLYFGQQPDGDNGYVVQDIVETFNNDEWGTITRHVSLELRSGAPPKFIGELLSEDENEGIYAFNKVLARVLKKYVTDGETAGAKCPHCQSPLRYEDGCAKCVVCGEFSKCS